MITTIYKPKNWFKRNYIEILIILGGFFLIHSFLLSKAYEGTEINGKNAGQFGSFIGGYLGTIFSLTSVVLIYSTLKTQRLSSELEKFENRFFELITLHKNNVAEIGIGDEYGKKVFILLIREFREILKITKQVYKNTHPNKELINIAYLTFYFGLGPNSSRVLRSYLSKYNNELTETFIIELKSRQKNIKKNRKFKFRPIGGHQSRLGHYYRHLFQTISYVHNKKIDLDKVEFVKIMRAQLSNHEQALLALNSLSDLGEDWNNTNLIDEYDFIKNIPKDFFNNSTEINLDIIFPNVNFEYKNAAS